MALTSHRTNPSIRKPIHPPLVATLSLVYVQIQITLIFDKRKKDTEIYILQPSMHIRWLKDNQTPFKKLTLNNVSVFRFSLTANDPQTGNNPRCRQQMIPPEIEECHEVCSSGRIFNRSFQFLI